MSPHPAPPPGHPLDAALIVRHIIAGFLAVNGDWVVQVANPKACTMLRRPASELEGRVLWDVFPGLGEPAIASQLRATRAGRVERRFELFSPELYNWFELWAVPAGNGDLYIFFKDVTDRARAMQSDAVREALRRTLMEAPIAISITRGAEHRYELLNHGARSLVGGRDLEGMTARNAMPEVDPALFDLLDRVYRTGEPSTVHDLEVTYDRDGNGSSYTGTFDVTYQPMRGADGSVEGVIQTAVETTLYTEVRKRIGTPTR